MVLIMDKLTEELIKILYQLLLLGVIGGAVSFFYSKCQKNRELRINALQQFTNLHGKFIALRYEYNSFFINWRGREATTKKRLTITEIENKKWECYARACQLIGEFQSIRPLISVLYSGHDEDLNDLYNGYQEWRRKSGADVPIFQDFNGHTADEFKQLRNKYSSLIKSLKCQI